MSVSRIDKLHKAISKQNNSGSHAARLDSDLLNDPLELLLTSGGDPRLQVDPIDYLNGYGCQPWPNPETLTFASSTATSISTRGFASAELARQQLVQSSRKKGLAAGCDQFAEICRKKLRNLLGIDATETEIIFSPSGTDSQIQAVYLAQTLLGGPLVSVIVASDETGSGTIYSATGRHFRECTAQGATVLKGKRIRGFAEDTTSVEIPLRGTNGRLRSRAAIDNEIAEVVGHLVAAGKRVLLHVMDTSKFGSRCPSLDCLSGIQASWGPSVQVVVDACQMRMSRRRLRYYLNQGFLVLITGSKFFTGPPLSGALLVPVAASAVMADTNRVPVELQLYSNQTDWPIAWPGVRSKLPARPNVGQLLRWAAALEEMRAFYAVPKAYRMLALRAFSLTVSRLIASNPNLHLLSTLRDTNEMNMDDEEMSARTIFPFFISRHGKFLSVEDCTRIYHALHCDVSSLLPRSATARQRQAGARCCHVGQPIVMRDPVQGIAGSLRISAGARVVSESWCAAGMAASVRNLIKEFDQVRTILDKIEILADNLDSLESVGEKYETPRMRNEVTHGLPLTPGVSAVPLVAAPPQLPAVIAATTILESDRQMLPGDSR